MSKNVCPSATVSAEAARLGAALAAALHSNDRALNKVLRWHPDQVDLDVARLTSVVEDWIAGAWTGRLFAHWHSGLTQPRTGPAGRGIGAALRDLDRAENVQRVLRRLVIAGDDRSMTDAVEAFGYSGRAADDPPHWPTVYDELRTWRDPRHRYEIRVRWARDFNR